VILVGGVTSPQAREAIRRSIRTIRSMSEYEESENRGVIMLAPPGRLENVPTRQVAGGGFFLLYLTGLGTALAVCARFVANTEAQACRLASSCAGHPVTYALAWRWLFQRLFFTDPSGLSPDSTQDTVLGWLVSLAAAMGVVVAYVAVKNHLARRRQVVSSHDERIGRVIATGRVLILVVTPEERDAVLRAVGGHVGQGPAMSYDDRPTVYALGSVAGTEIMLARAGEQGAASVSAMYETARAAIRRCRPDYVILVGICYGLRPDKGQQPGDIIVARQVHNIDHRKVLDEDGAEREIPRGAKVYASPGLIDQFQAGECTWKGAPVHFGLMLTSSMLVNSEPTVVKLRKDFEEALGGEMEGTAVYEATRLGVRPDWIMVKAISDWGCRKSDDQQRLAADNAADFVIHVIASGALRGRPVR
jgi:nucleoside phosphorylase